MQPLPQSRRLRHRLLDSTTPEHIVASTVVTGLLTLIPPSKLGPYGRAALHLSTGIVGGIITAASLRHSPEARMFPGAIFSVSVGTAGLTTALGETSDVIDGSIERGLARRGVPRPRLWMAAGAALATAAAGIWSSRMDARSRDSSDTADEGYLDQPRLTALPPELTILVATMLEQTVGIDVSALDIQLATAQLAHWDGESDEVSVFSFEVAPDAPRVTPFEFELPVSARFIQDGREISAVLVITRGRLSSLVLDYSEPSEAPFDEPFEGVERLPALEDVTFVDELRGVLTR